MKASKLSDVAGQESAAASLLWSDRGSASLPVLAVSGGQEVRVL